MSPISRTPGICGGRYRIRGTGVSVSTIVGYFAAGYSVRRINADYPHLTRQQIEAALRWDMRRRARRRKGSR